MKKPFHHRNFIRTELGFEPPSKVFKRREIEEVFFVGTRFWLWAARLGLLVFVLIWALRGQAAQEVQTLEGRVPEVRARHWIVEGEVQAYAISSLGGPMIGSVLSYQIENQVTVGFRPMLSTTQNQNFSFGSFYRKGFSPRRGTFFGEASLAAHYRDAGNAIYGGAGLSVGKTFFPVSEKYPLTGSVGMEWAMSLWIPKMNLAFGVTF